MVAPDSTVMLPPPMSPLNSSTPALSSTSMNVDATRPPTFTFAVEPKTTPFAFKR